MAWVAPAIMAAASVYGATQSGDSKAGGEPMYAMKNMPTWLQDKFTASMQGMPGGLNVGFGGQMYPMTYGPLARTASSLYKPVGAIGYDQTPSGMSSAMAAMLPWMYMYGSGGGKTPTPSGGMSMGPWSSPGYTLPPYTEYGSYM